MSKTYKFYAGGDDRFLTGNGDRAFIEDMMFHLASEEWVKIFSFKPLEDEEPLLLDLLTKNKPSD